MPRVLASRLRGSRRKRSRLAREQRHRGAGSGGRSVDGPRSLVLRVELLAGQALLVSVHPLTGQYHVALAESGTDSSGSMDMLRKVLASVDLQLKRSSHVGVAQVLCQYRQLSFVDGATGSAAALKVLRAGAVDELVAQVGNALPRGVTATRTYNAPTQRCETLLPHTDCFECCYNDS